MEIAITKMSENGQVVIPAEIRKDAGALPATKFIVFNRGGNIFLRPVRTETRMENARLIKKIEKSEEQIKKGKFVCATTEMSDEDIDRLLMV